jgi:hypothetical protein
MHPLESSRTAQTLPLHEGPLKREQSIVVFRANSYRASYRSSIHLALLLVKVKG